MAEKKINGKTFRHSKRLVLRALELKYRLAAFIGADAADLPTMLAGAGPRRDGETPEAHAAREAASNGAVVKMLAGMLRGNSPAQFLDLVREFIETDDAVQIKRPSGDWDTVDIDSDLDEADFLELMAFVLREEFAAFFDALPRLSQLRGGKGKSA